MSGIGRVLAGVLLVGAVGGAAAFARESGSDLSAPAIGLAAPPQHIGAPGTVIYALTTPRTLVAVIVRDRRPFRHVIAAPPPAPMPTPAPTPAPMPERTVILAPVPVPARALAAVPVPIGHGRALGHAKQHGPAADPTPVDPGGNGNGNAWGHSKDRGAPTAD